MADKNSYYRLFAAYVLAMVSTGVAVVALALVGFELAGEDDAPGVIGAALALKTLAYVVGAPVAAAALGGLPRRELMIGLDLVRAGALLALPFVDALWQLYALILVFSFASAAFTPAYQASVPALLPDPEDYAKSLARSRAAAELEGAVSPLIAALLLAALAPRGVFLVTMAGFLGSALLLAGARLPAPPATRTTKALRGLRLLLAAPALRGLAPLALAAGAATAMVTVNAAPIVLGRFGLDGRATALALAASGLGAVVGALLLPRLMRGRGERALMLGGGALMAGALALSAGAQLFATLLALWAAVGFGAAMAQAPAAALIRRVVAAEDRQAVYAANLSLGAAAAGLGYAAAGALDLSAGLPRAMLAFAAVAGLATLAAAALWPARPAGGS